jgi:hypothetical protein
MLNVTVNGGTGAGRKMRPQKTVHTVWTCQQGHINASWWKTCSTPRCREKRPT